MSQMTTEQIAQLMLGVAKAQLAILDSVENMKAGFKFTHVRPTLETASRIRSNAQETLSDFPSRLLLQMLGRNPPALERVTHDLKALVSGRSTAPPPPAAAGDAGGDSLDMTQN
ncbi:MAG: hypothetical protein ACO3F9_12835 [Burkholderiales bacterium]